MSIAKNTMYWLIVMEIMSGCDDLKALELFAGIGGIALAAEWAGIETVAFCERDEFCQKVLKKHWSHVPIFDDIRTLDKQKLQSRGVDVGSIELISGGFPCQPYSVAGERRGKEDDRDLWPEMFRIIEEIKPTWVVGENVANFVNMELDRTLFDLESIGYKTRTFLLPASSVGATHRRYRVFVVANSNSEGWPRFLKSDTDTIQGGEKERFTKLRFDVDYNLGIPHIPEDIRMDDGIPYRMDRARGLGNAVVPQQIYPIFKAIMKIENNFILGG